jgi:hypothetical protein
LESLEKITICIDFSILKIIKNSKTANSPFDLVAYTVGSGSHAMTKKKGPQMTHAAQDALLNEIQSLIESEPEVNDEELAERERKATEIVEGVRARVSRRERA